MKMHLEIHDKKGVLMVREKYENPWPFVPRVGDSLSLHMLNECDDGYDGKWVDTAVVDDVCYDPTVVNDMIYIHAVAAT